jgi:hypothetical protein
MDEQGPRRVKEIGFPADLDMVEGADQIHHATRIDIHAKLAQDASEQQKVVQELSAQSTPAFTRSRIKRACVPLTFSTSS